MIGIPYDDAQSLLVWVEHHLDEVPPLALERLLTHYGFEEAGTMRTPNQVHCVVWKHTRRAESPKLAEAMFLVYHTETVSRERVTKALQLIDRTRRLVIELGRRTAV